MRHRRAVLMLLALVLLVPALAQGQTVVINPTTVEFDASPDHATLVVGVPVVTGYRLEFYLVGASAPFQAGADLGKPTVDPGGRVVVTQPSLFAIPIGGYVARVVAYGPGGEAASPPSDPFGVLGPPGAGGKPSVRR